MRRLAYILLLVVAVARADGPGRVIDTSPGVVFGGLAQSAALPIVAVGLNFATYSFDHGSSWSTGTIPAGTYTAVTFNGSVYVTVGLSGAAARSTDGITWSDVSIAGSTRNFRGIAWSGSVFVAVGDWASTTDATIYTSPDGITWTKQNDGVTWQTAPTNSRIARGSGTRVVIWTNAAVPPGGAADRRALRSDDGVTWTLVSAANSTNLINGFASNGSFFIGISGGAPNSGVTSSDNGDSWSNLSSGIPVQATCSHAKCIARNGTRWTSVRSGGTTGNYSDDGLAWTLMTTGVLRTGVCWSGVRFVAVGTAGAFQAALLSTDGITWTSSGTGTMTTSVNDVACPIVLP